MVLRVVLDTNVLVSALYLPASKPGTIVGLARRRLIQNLVSPAILREVERVLREKFQWEAAPAKEAVRQIENFSKVVEPQDRLTVLADDPDNRILECAQAGQAHLILTGDKHLLQLQVFGGIAILKPADFFRARHAAGD